jgi:predicted MFS family arabinose efflux permease
LEKIQAFIYIGGLVGVILGSYLNGYIGKRRLLIITVLLNIIGVGLTILANSLFLAAVGLFINFAAKSVQSEVIPCILTESVG